MSPHHEIDPQAPQKEAALFYGLFLRGHSADTLRRGLLLFSRAGRMALALPARDGAEQCGVANPAPVQFRLVSAQRGDDLFSINADAHPRPTPNLTHRGPFIRHPRAQLPDPRAQDTVQARPQPG